MMAAHAVQQELNDLELQEIREMTGKPDATHFSLEGNAVTDYYLAIRGANEQLLGYLTEDLA